MSSGRHRDRSPSRSERLTARLGHHWVLVTTLLLVVAIGLFIASPFRAVGAGLYSAQPGTSSDHVPSALQEGNPSAIGPDGTNLAVLTPKPRHIALTFDDGPDPTWTPKIQEVLDRHGVKGTFFVVGSEVVRHPLQVKALADDGNEIGSHTFSHINLSYAPAWRTKLELAATQLMIQGATGESTSLVRPPFSSTAAAVDDHDWSAVRRLADLGYVTSLSTVDAEDWKSPNADQVMRDIAKHPSAGQVVLMHDGGGDRSKTVAELDDLLTRLKAQGYTIGTMGQTIAVDAEAPVTGPQHALASAVLFGLWLCATIVRVLSWAVLAGGVLAAIRAVVILWANVRHRRDLRTRPRLTDAGPVTVVVPAYNEAAGIEATIRSLAASTHSVEIIVVDDGSTDETSAIARRVAASLPDADVRVITKPNGGKPSALNAGLAATRTELVVMVDGDTVFEPDTIARLIENFADPRVGAVSGNAKVTNRGGILGRWQHIEYVIGFNMDRRLYDVAECMPTVPGAIGAFRTQALRDIGGIGTDTLAEDTDATMALGRRGWLVRYAPEARAWTEAPATVKALWSQRYRWSYGTMQAMWKHRDGLLKPGAEGRYLRRSLTYMALFQVLLPLLSPAVDLFAVYGIFSLDPVRVGAVWIAFMLVDLVIAVVAFRADRERLGPLWALPLTQVLYRQLMYLVVIQSLATAVTGRRLRWQRMERYGVHAQPSSGSTPAAA